MNHNSIFKKLFQKAFANPLQALNLHLLLEENSMKHSTRNPLYGFGILMTFFYLDTREEQLKSVLAHFNTYTLQAHFNTPQGLIFILQLNFTYEQYSGNLFLNPFQSSVTFLYPLETSKNLWFSDVFMGHRNVTLD